MNIWALFYENLRETKEMFIKVNIGFKSIRVVYPSPGRF